MKNIIIFSFILLAAASCQEKDKVAELQEAREQLEELQDKIAQLESELGPDTLQLQEEEKAVLIAALELQKKSFEHRIDVRGTVESRRNVMLSAETPGRIQKIYVREGQEVKKGQKLLELDADVIRNSISTLKTQLELAETVYERQKRLWDKNIGTEIQYLEAKSRKETLEAELATTYSQLNQAVVKAPFSGVVDEVPAREGELAQPGMPLMRMMSPQMMYIEADVSEKFLGDIKVGDPVIVDFPVQDQSYTTKVAAVSNVINKANRTFSVEVDIPKDVDFQLSPNQVVVMKLTDYRSEDALVVPSEVILSDMDGTFLYTVSKEGDKFHAVKTRVEPGRTHEGMTEILAGLTPDDNVIVKGYRNVSDGVAVKFAEMTQGTAQL